MKFVRTHNSNVFNESMKTEELNSLRILLFSMASVIAFASNSIICRLALREDTIDAGSFTVIRLVSGAVALWLILIISGYRKKTEYQGSWTSASMLFLYAIAFSFAYIELDAGVGALIMFGAVQVTMLLTGLVQGERSDLLQWGGMIAAFSGLVYLVSPGLTAPPFLSSALMLIAGVSWGVYSLRGRGNNNPIAVTTDNFIRTIPFAFIVAVALFPQIQLTTEGFLWAVLSGAVTSGIGYIIWYTALRGLTRTRASVIQLSVPVIAAIGGVILLSEDITLRLVLSAILTLGGIAIVILRKA